MFLLVGVNALSYTWLVHNYAPLKTERKNILNKLLKLIIIHQVKTKKITTVKEVWIPGLNKHKL